MLTEALLKDGGLQRKEFSEKVGLSERQVLNYCDLNVFNPVRPQGAPNNRRYFTDTDFKTAEIIHILLKLGYKATEIGCIFEEKDHNLDQILELAITNMKKRIVHDRNLVMAAEYAQAVGTSVFSFGSMNDPDIDQFANAIRKSESYKNSRRYVRKLTTEDSNALTEKFESLIQGFSILEPSFDDEAQFSENFFKVESLVDEYASIYSEISGIESHHVMLALSGIYFFGDGALSTQADSIGGEGTAEFIGICFLMSWLKRMSRLVFPLVLLLDNPGCDDAQRGNILNELFSLFDTIDISDANPYTAITEVDPNEVFVNLISMVFDFAKEFASDQNYVQALFIDKELIPTNEQFDKSLSLLKEYAGKSSEGKGK